MTSAENSISEPPNLKIFGGGYPPGRPPYKARAIGIRDNAPLATALKSENVQSHSSNSNKNTAPL